MQLRYRVHRPVAAHPHRCRPRLHPPRAAAPHGAAQQGPRRTATLRRGERPGDNRSILRHHPFHGVRSAVLRRHATAASVGVSLTLDTGSDLTWTQCAPCVACFDQALPYFYRSLSSSLGMFSCTSSRCQELPLLSSCGTERGGWGNQTCVYTYWYGDRSVTTGLLLSDTFSFAGAVAVPDLAFGCGFFNHGYFLSNETGVAGFGRGALSLPSQLKVDNFSYCFTTVTGSAPSTILLGLPANLHSGAHGAIQTTPLIQNPADQSLTYYYLSVPPGAKPDVPKLVLHFEVATLDLPWENYMFEFQEAGHSNICLPILETPGQDEMTIIGNYQQQNMHVLYDLAKNKLSFVPAHCDRV
ncbi:hypothetical protein EJB05_06873, partial [Eragrostis curvula]